jgi:acyl-coenzyme A synthetase/AMP-(fatty) acid ligase
MLQPAFGARAGADAATASPNSAYPLIRHAEEYQAVAIRSGRRISRRQFLADATALAARLPAQNYVVNLCADRYRFMVGFVAALFREQITLLPPNDKPVVLKALESDYRDVYALVDTTRVALPSVIFPETLEPPPEPFDLPAIPEHQLAVILFTSGSTGRPKPVLKSWGVLVRSALSAGDRLGIKEAAGGAVIGTVPHQHSYGLESVTLLAMQHGMSVVAERLFYPADIQAALAAAPRPRILITTPVHLRALVGQPWEMPALDLIVSATAPLSPALAAQAEECFRGPLIEIYGCTEAGQIATRQTVRQSHWRCLNAVALRQQNGATWVEGPAVPSATPLQDVIECAGRDEFLLVSRSAELVDVAGKHATLGHLNHQLLSIEGVEDGAFIAPNPRDQRIPRLAAFVVAPGLDAGAILQALRERIDAAFLPRPLLLVDALPRNSMGKLPRETLMQLLQQNRSD